MSTSHCDHAAAHAAGKGDDLLDLLERLRTDVQLRSSVLIGEVAIVKRVQDGKLGVADARRDARMSMRE